MSKVINDRKKLYVILSIVVILIFTLTVVYAALSTTLNITGNAEVTAASWDIYLDNIQLNSSSATKNIPTISNKTTASFSTTLSEPGDFYEFTVDVVNNGTIDAMIDSVTKLPELTTEQTKYLKYEVEYQNGDAITTKQLVTKNSFVRLKVRIGFRGDISSSDIPESSEMLKLSFTVNYVQSDATSVSVKNSGVSKIEIINGNLDTVGSEVAIADEHFYVISSNDDSVSMLAKYNLYVGNRCTSASKSSCAAYGEEATGLQNSTMTGYDALPRNGVIEFSSTNYWSSKVSAYPEYVYDSNSTIFPYIENYKAYLESQDVAIEEARLIKVEELNALGCNSSKNTCSGAPRWVYSTSYWTGTAHIYNSTLGVYSGSGELDPNDCFYYTYHIYGVRPVITISR